MKKDKFKKKYFVISWTLVIVGVVILFGGFAFGGFKIDNLKQDEYSWYHTIRLNEKGISYGIIGEN